MSSYYWLFPLAMVCVHSNTQAVSRQCNAFIITLEAGSFFLSSSLLLRFAHFSEYLINPSNRLHFENSIVGLYSITHKHSIVSKKCI